MVSKASVGSEALFFFDRFLVLHSVCKQCSQPHDADEKHHQRGDHHGLMVKSGVILHAHHQKNSANHNEADDKESCDKAHDCPAFPNTRTR